MVQENPFDSRAIQRCCNHEDCAFGLFKIGIVFDGQNQLWHFAVLNEVNSSNEMHLSVLRVLAFYHTCSFAYINSDAFQNNVPDRQQASVATYHYLRRRCRHINH